MSDIYQDQINKIFNEYDSLNEYFYEYIESQHNKLVQCLFNNYYMESETDFSCELSSSLIERQLLKIHSIRRYFNLKVHSRLDNKKNHSVNDHIVSWINKKNNPKSVRWLMASQVNEDYLISDIDLLYKFLEQVKEYFVAIGSSNSWKVVIRDNDQYVNIKFCLCTSKIGSDVFEQFLNPFYKNTSLSITSEMSLSLASIRKLAEKRSGEIVVTKGDRYIGFELRLKCTRKKYSKFECIKKNNGIYKIFLFSYDDNFIDAVNISLEGIENTKISVLSINQLNDCENIEQGAGLNILYCDLRYGAPIKDKLKLNDFFNKTYFFYDDLTPDILQYPNSYSVLNGSRIFGCYFGLRKEVGTCVIDHMNMIPLHHKMVYIYDKNPIYINKIKSYLEEKSVLSNVILNPVHLEEALTVAWPDVITIDTRFGISTVHDLIQLVTVAKDNNKQSMPHIVLLISSQEEYVSINNQISYQVLFFFRQVQVDLLFKHLLI